LPQLRIEPSLPGASLTATDIDVALEIAPREIVVAIPTSDQRAVTLATGFANALPAAMALETVIPANANIQLAALPLVDQYAALQKVTTPTKPTPPTKPESAKDKNVPLLWGVLFVGVLALGAMAWGAMRQLRAK
jgi:hypothetical protein